MLRIGYICDTALLSGNEIDDVTSRTSQVEEDRTALIQAGCKVIRFETARPSRAVGVVLKAIIDFADQGDEIVIARLNQISDSSPAVLTVLKTLRGRGIGLRLLDAGLNREGLVDDALIKVLEMICSLEDRPKNRALSPANTGRRPRVTTDDIRSLQARGMNAVQIAEHLRVSRMTVWRKLQQA